MSIWIKTNSGISVLSNKGYEQLANYMELHGNKVKQEHDTLFNALWTKYKKEWNKLPFQEQLKQHIEADNKLLDLK